MEAYLEISDSLLWEIEFFIKALALGLVIRGLYDFLIVWRRLVKHGTFWTGVEDVIYCTLGGIITFSMFYSQNQGAFRVYALMGIIIGMILYHFGPSRMVCCILEHLAALLSFPVKMMKKIKKKLSENVEKL